MTKKLFKQIGIGCIVLLLMWILIRVTGMLQFYTVPTTGNAPAIQYNETIIASNLIGYERLDIVCYNKENQQNHATEVWVRRICGIPGDIIQLIDGTLFVNGKNVDQQISTMHDYFVNKSQVNKLKNEFSSPICDGFSDTCRLSLEDKSITKNMHARRYVNNKKGLVHKQFNAAWTIDNFGPMVVPKGFLFLLGDNRHNSNDSRISGLVSEADVVGVVLN